MKFAPSSRTDRARARAAFTLAEVLAALLFMAIVIPVALNGLRIASLAAQVGERKTVAARVAERVLNEQTLPVVATTGGNNTSGSITEGPYEYRWTVQSVPWTEGTLQLMTVKVTYQVQGRDYEVTVSTLMDSATL
ncbi:MAG: hypothetical protein EBS05_22230 [Proteobacteria bacterium]|nr:hypothetical protein [Pseudomonadota bacterium]